jgi:hypothetical protein
LSLGAPEPRAFDGEPQEQMLAIVSRTDHSLREVEQATRRPGVGDVYLALANRRRER